VSGVMIPLGWIVSTPGAVDAFEKAGETPDAYLRRHASGDWGELDEHDKEMNRLALDQPDRIFSCYRLKDRTKFYVITEFDRSSTTILLPSEY
jgi:hypothetical protein